MASAAQLRSYHAHRAQCSSDDFNKAHWADLGRKKSLFRYVSQFVIVFFFSSGEEHSLTVRLAHDVCRHSAIEGATGSRDARRQIPIGRSHVQFCFLLGQRRLIAFVPATGAAELRSTWTCLRCGRG